MSLDVYLEECRPSEVYSRNITHNLTKMAGAAGIYEYLWRPEEVGVKKAHDLIEPLARGLMSLIAAPERYQQYNPENGWGNYQALLGFVSDYLLHCIVHPNADVRVSR